MEGKKRILICDDEEGVRESLNLILSERYNVSFARNAKEAMDFLKTNPDIKLILLDIKMPETDGLEVLKEIKKKYAHLNILVVTGYQSVEVATEAIKNGACGYIVKPFNSKELLETVAHALNK